MGEGWLSRDMVGFSREVDGTVGRWVAKQRDGWLSSSVVDPDPLDP